MQDGNEIKLEIHEQKINNYKTQNSHTRNNLHPLHRCNATKSILF